MTNLPNYDTARGRHLSSVSAAALGGALLMMAAPHAAFAQAAPTPAAVESADIVVTGFRRSVENSIKIKKLSTSIIESVTAEDVGKLPDNSITESLSRLPGVTSQRLAGRADILSVRGFGPDFTVALFNHREIATTGDDRGFQYDQIPSELVNRGDVIKTPSARQIGQGLAGTIDLQTIDPLQQAHTIASVSARGELDSYSKLNPDEPNRGYRMSMIYVDKFANDTIGLSVGGTILSSPQQNKQYEAWGFPTDSKGNYILGGGKFFATSNLETRQSGFARLEYRPSTRFEMSFDAFVSHFKTEEQQRGLEVPLAWGSGPAATNITTSNGFDTAATFSNVYSVQRNNYNGRDANTVALGWNLKYGISDTIKLNVDASYSRAHRHDTDLETYSGLGYNKTGTSNTFTVTQQANGTYALSGLLNYNNPSAFQLTDPQGWGYNGVNTVVQAGFLNAPDFIDEIKALRADLTGQINSSFFKSWEVGASYSKRKKTAGFKGYFLQPGSSLSVNTLPIPSSIVYAGGVTPTNYTSGTTLAYDALQAMNLLTPVQDVRPSAALTRDWVVAENIMTGYVQLNIDSKLGGIPVRGNLGVQVVNTDQSSVGNSATEVTVTDPVTKIQSGSIVLLPSSGGAKYTYALPSINLGFEVAHNMVVRLSGSRSLSRARQGDLAVPFSYTGSPVAYGTLNGNKPYYFQGSGGNPQLRPYISDNADLAAEKYFAHGAGLIRVTGFYKSLSQYVDPNNSVLVDFSSVAGQLLSPAQLAVVGTNTVGVVSAPANTGKGNVKGVEVDLTLPFSVFTPALDGFGVILNGGYTDSSVHYGNNASITVPGLSDKVYSATAFYEKNGFQVRVNYTYRSAFLGETSTVTQAASLSTINATRILDAQIGYEFKHGPMKGLSLVLQGKNLTNAPFYTYNGNDPRQIIHYETYGSTYLFGATYKF